MAPTLSSAPSCPPTAQADAGSQRRHDVAESLAAGADQSAEHVGRLDREPDLADRHQQPGVVDEEADRVLDDAESGDQPAAERRRDLLHAPAVGVEPLVPALDLLAEALEQRQADLAE